jgi:cation:H+ antiporter
MIFALLGIIFVLCLILIKSSDEVVLAVHRLSKNSTSVAFVISALFLAIATSLPEMFVAITAGLGEVSSLSLGNIMGANIANITLVAGVAALMVGSVDVHQKFVKKEILIAGIAGVLPFLLMFIDGKLGRVDGIILISAYLLYALSFFKERFLHISQNLRESHFFYKLFRKIKHTDSHRGKEILRLILGIVGLLISSNMLVSMAKTLAVIVGIPVFLVGLIIVSIGTTLPELVFSVRSLRSGEPTMFLGNLLGSIIVNSTLLTGIAVILAPINSFLISEYIIAFTVFVIVFSLFWVFTKTGRRFERKEAAILLSIYIVFVVLLFL